MLSREGEIGRDLAEARIGDDGCGPGAVLLGRLEHQDNAPARRAVARQAARERSEDGGVAVMAAEMRLPRRRRAVRNVADLLDRQGIQLGPEQQRRPGSRPW